MEGGGAVGGSEYMHQHISIQQTDAPQTIACNQISGKEDKGSWVGEACILFCSQLHNVFFLLFFLRTLLYMHLPQRRWNTPLDSPLL